MSGVAVVVTKAGAVSEQENWPDAPGTREKPLASMVELPLELVTV